MRLINTASFSIPLIPTVPFDNAPPGVRPLVLGSQAGAIIGGGMGLENTIQDAYAEDQSLPKALAKGTLNVAGGATLGTLTGLSGGVLLNRARNINNTDALNYANRYVFGEPSSFSYMGNIVNFANLVPITAGIGAVKGMLEQPGGAMTDPNTGAIVNRTYTPVERLLNVGINAGIGAGVGYGGNKLGLNNSKTIGNYIGRAKRFGKGIGNDINRGLEDIRQQLPEVKVNYKKTPEGQDLGTKESLPPEILDVVNESIRNRQ